MSILLDTCVLAEERNPNGSPAVKAALGKIDDSDLFLSVLTIGEIAKGISLLSPSKKKQELAVWLDGLEARFSDRLLLVDREVAFIWGDTTAQAAKRGIIIPAVDGLLAATASRHGLCLWTRNVRHFEATGALLHDPWSDDLPRNGD